MAKKQIIWSNSAKKELKNILDYYIERNGSPNYSNKLLSEIEDFTETLSLSNFIGRLTSNKKTRVIPMKVYLIFYEVDKEFVKILSIWDNRQNEQKRNVKL